MTRLPANILASAAAASAGSPVAGYRSSRCPSFSAGLASTAARNATGEVNTSGRDSGAEGPSGAWAAGPPAGSQERAPQQWANRIVDFRWDAQARDAVRALLAQGPQIPSAYCAHDHVARVLAAAAPQAEHAALHDAATLITDMWNLAVQLHLGHIPPATAASAASHLYLQFDQVTYAAVSRHHNTTAVALQRAALGCPSGILELTGFQLYDTLVANPHVKRRIRQGRRES